MDTNLDCVVPLTLHDLLQLHLQGLDGSGRVVSYCALYPVYGQPAFHHSSHIIVLQKYYAVGVLDHCTANTREQNIHFHALRLSYPILDMGEGKEHLKAEKGSQVKIC